MGNKKKFRNYLINRKFQLHYMLLIFAFLILVSTSVFLSFYIGFKIVIYDEFSFKKTMSDLKNIDRMAGQQAARFKQAQMDNENPTPDDMMKRKEQIEAEKLSEKQTELFDFLLKSISQKAFLILIFLITIITFGTMFVTHRIAGPLYRIHMLLKEIKRGNLNVNFKLRKGDQLQELASVLDNLFSGFRVSINELINSSNKLMIKYDELISKTRDIEIKKDLLAIRDDVNEISNICTKMANEEAK